MALPALATTRRKCNQSAHRIPYNDLAAHRAIQRQRSAWRKYNQSAEVRASHPVQRPRSASRKCNQSVEVRASHPVQRPRIALRGPRIELVSFRLVRGTIFSKIQYINLCCLTDSSTLLDCPSPFERHVRPQISGVNGDQRECLVAGALEKLSIS